ncbi:membrane protein [Nocardia sp. BMG51109]|uniref:DoxX family protein n=1 Tax=Nocardia sp. BMG51109 TaxID=1056816 RepID=UPI000464DD03|nr:membrane protein [Nocardia sp. BMG51109]
MAPLIVLIVVTAVARLAGPIRDGWLDSWPHAVRIGLAAMFALTASAHFFPPRRAALIAMVPTALPAAPALVTANGILEIAGAVGLLIAPVAPASAIFLALLMVAMFPANVRAAGADLGIKSMPLPLRTLVQVLFIGACVVAVF